VYSVGDAGVNTRVGKQFQIPRKVKLYERVCCNSHSSHDSLVNADGIHTAVLVTCSPAVACVVRVQASPNSKKVGQLVKGAIVTVLEETQWEGEEYVRCEDGWLSVNSASGRANLRLVKDEL
jgi:hypothetical protein